MSGSPSTTVQPVGSAALESTISGLSPNTGYTVQVRGINGAGDGINSAPTTQSTSFGGKGLNLWHSATNRHGKNRALCDIDYHVHSYMYVYRVTCT